MSALASGLVKKTTSYNVDPSQVCRREGWNDRFDFGDIASLATSIRVELKRDPSTGGLLNPIRVKRLDPKDPRAEKFAFELVDGDRRLTAIQQLLSQGEVFPEGIAAKLVERTQDDLTSLIQMYTANTGKPFLPLEAAASFKRMREADMTLTQIAQATGHTEAHIIDTMALLSADVALQEAVRDGKVGASVAKIIATTARGDLDTQKDMLADALASKGTTEASKAAKARLSKKITDHKAKKAQAKGRVVKIRALDDAQLSQLGALVAELLTTRAKEHKFEYDGTELGMTAMLESVKKDEGMAMAYTLGALHGLRAAAGLSVNFDI